MLRVASKFQILPILSSFVSGEHEPIVETWTESGTSLSSLNCGELENARAETAGPMQLLLNGFMLNLFLRLSDLCHSWPKASQHIQWTHYFPSLTLLAFMCPTETLKMWLLCISAGTFSLHFVIIFSTFTGVHSTHANPRCSIFKDMFSLRTNMLNLSMLALKFFGLGLSVKFFLF